MEDGSKTFKTEAVCADPEASISSVRTLRESRSLDPCPVSVYSLVTFVSRRE